MKTELTLNVLQTMNAQEYEDIRAAGSDERRELTHAVMRELDAPDNWTMNGEYGSEFGGFFPVQVRFTPAHERFHLAFHSPETVGSWHARWSDRVAEHDLETLFWQWGERFPSLAGMERWQWQDMPFWQVIAEASLAAREAGHAVREMERWMVPNKLREAA